MLGGMSDGCNTMEGRHSGVTKRLADIIPQFADTGSCNSHHIGNAFEYGVKRFDNVSQEALVNIFFDLGGAKGNGLKRKKNSLRKSPQTKALHLPNLKKCAQQDLGCLG